MTRTPDITSNRRCGNMVHTMETATERTEDSSAFLKLLQALPERSYV